MQHDNEIHKLSDITREKEILEAIKKIEGTPNLKKKMIENGLKYSKNFSDEIIAKNLMIVYQAL